MGICSICECGELDQTGDHVILECPLHRAPKGYHRLLAWMTSLDASLPISLPKLEEGLSL